VEVAMRALDRPVDRYLDYALWLTARELEPYWLPALQAGRLDFGGNTRHLLFALQAVGREGIKPLVALLKAGKIAKERQESVLLLMAAVGGPEELRLVFDHVLSADGGQAGTRAKLLAALQEASRQRSVRPAGDLSRVGKLLTAEDEAVRAAAAQLAGLWKLESFRPQLLDYARAAGTSEPLRKAAFAALTQLGGPASQQAFEQLAGPSHPPEMRVLAVTALTSADLQSAARHAVELLRSNLSDADTTELITTFVRRKGGTAVLAKNLANQKLPADVAKIALRTTRASGRDAPVLVEALTKAGGLTSKRPPLTHREMEQLVADVVQHGNPYRGEMIFRRKDLACLKCHAIAGAGGQVGPDLISLGASAPIDYLIDSILLPNKAIKENYHSLVVGTKDGRVFTGIKVRETSSELILRDAEDRDVAIPIQAIEERANGGSLMPEGLADSLTRRELVDLVRFLSELGKVGPFAVSKARLVRRWQAVEPTAEARRLLQAGGLNGAIADDHALSWTPVYSTVSGLLPLNALPGLRTDSGTFALVRCQFEASTNAKARLKLNTAKGLTLWLDRAPLETKQEVVLDLAAGTHTITVAINLGERSKGLRCELDAAPGSAARVHIVKGK
jgi:putative heme-binding domain-containing protein